MCFITDSSSSSDESSSDSDSSRSRSRSPEDNQQPEHQNEPENQQGDAANENNPSTSKDADKKDGKVAKQLDENFLEAIGNRLVTEKILGPPLHDDLMVRWKDVLKEGLPKEEKENMAKKYHQPENCTFVDAPKVNKRAKELVQAPVIDRDNRLVAKQEKVGLCLAAISHLMIKIFDKEKIDDVYFIKVLSDISRLLLDLQRDENITRRALMTSNLPHWLKELIDSTTVDEWLFGDDFDKNLKEAQEMQKSNKEIKSLSQNFQNRSAKNFKSPLRRNFKKSKSQSGQTKHQPYRPKQGYKKPQDQHHQTSPKWSKRRHQKN